MLNFSAWMLTGAEHYVLVQKAVSLTFSMMLIGAEHYLYKKQSLYPLPLQLVYWQQTPSWRPAKEEERGDGLERLQRRYSAKTSERSGSQLTWHLDARKRPRYITCSGV